MKRVFDATQHLAGSTNISRKVLDHVHRHFGGNAQVAKGCEVAIEKYGSQAIEGITLSIISMWKQLDRSRLTKKFLKRTIVDICHAEKFCRTFLLKKGVLGNPEAKSRRWVAEIYAREFANEVEELDKEIFRSWLEARGSDLHPHEKDSFLPIIHIFLPDRAASWSMDILREKARKGEVSECIDIVNQEVARAIGTCRLEDMTLCLMESLPRGGSSAYSEIKRSLEANPIVLSESNFTSLISAAARHLEPLRNKRDNYVQALVSRSLNDLIKRRPDAILDVDAYASGTCVAKYWLQGLTMEWPESRYSKKFFQSMDFALKSDDYVTAFLTQCGLSEEWGKIPTWAQSLASSVASDRPDPHALANEAVRLIREGQGLSSRGPRRGGGSGELRG